MIVSRPVKPTAFGNFIHDKYRHYKAPNRNHRTVMRLLGAAFKALTDRERRRYNPASQN